MRRAEFEVRELPELCRILSHCDVIRIGFSGPPPYIVPVSFGYEVRGNVVCIYFHSASAGEKVKRLAQGAEIAVEADCFAGYTGNGADITASYESVMGLGTAELLSGDEAVHGLQCMMAHCGFPESPVETCASISRVHVYRITLYQIVGKRHVTDS